MSFSGFCKVCGEAVEGSTYWQVGEDVAHIDCQANAEGTVNPTK